MEYILKTINFLKNLDYIQFILDVFSFGIFGALKTQKLILKKFEKEQH
jgi:hypothetical protein